MAEIFLYYCGMCGIIRVFPSRLTMEQRLEGGRNSFCATCKQTTFHKPVALSGLRHIFMNLDG